MKGSTVPMAAYSIVSGQCSLQCYEVRVSNVILKNPPHSLGIHPKIEPMVLWVGQRQLGSVKKADKSAEFMKQNSE